MVEIMLSSAFSVFTVLLFRSVEVIRFFCILKVQFVSLMILLQFASVTMPSLLGQWLSYLMHFLTYISLDS